MRWTKVIALAAVGTLSLTACGGGGSPADDANKSSATGGSATGTTGGGGGATEAPKKASAALVPDAKGPAPEVEGAKKGGTLRFYAAGSPETFDPSAQFIQDVNQYLRLTNRTLTQYRVEPDGSSVLVPDLATDLGTVSDDGLTWTFTIKKGLKYEDGSPITAADVAYAVKRSFAQEELPGGPTYQLDYLKDGKKYKGPYKDGEDFAGVEAKGDQVIFHLAKPWPSLPYFGAFSQTSPIPKAKDTKEKYTEHPIASGPYKFKDYRPGSKLVLERNDQWDPESDPARHQFPDTIEVTFQVDPDAAARQILASTGPDATAVSYDGVPAALVSEYTGAKKDQLVTGASPCVSYVSMDTTVIPLEVRKAIATAWPYDQIRAAVGSTQLDYAPARSYMHSNLPGFTVEPSELLPGQGKGDPEKAKQMLKDAGKEGFELSYYYSQDNPVAVKANTARKAALEKAGFTVKPVGVPRAEIRDKVQETDHKRNLLMGPAGWCYDWPTGDGVYPAIFHSSVAKTGNSTGMLEETKVDKEIERIQALPADEQNAEWSAFDKMLREEYLPAIPTDEGKTSVMLGAKVRNVKVEANNGMPEMATIWVDQ